MNTIQTNSSSGSITLGGVGGGVGGGVPVWRSNGIALDHSGINLHIVKANGGWIIQIHHPTDSLTGAYKKSDLYVINDDADFDRELGKILTIQCLKVSYD